MISKLLDMVSVVVGLLVAVLICLTFWPSHEMFQLLGKASRDAGPLLAFALITLVAGIAVCIPFQVDKSTHRVDMHPFAVLTYISFMLGVSGLGALVMFGGLYDDVGWPLVGLLPVLVLLLLRRVGQVTHLFLRSRLLNLVPSLQED